MGSEYPFGSGVTTRGKVVEVRPEPTRDTAAYKGAPMPKKLAWFWRWLLRIKGV